MTIKKITLPKELRDLMVGTRDEWVRNPLSGEECKLTPQAVAVYDFIMGVQMMHPNGMPHKAIKELRSGLDWFRNHYPKEYMTLLD
jgi:hypothetical protein